MADSLSVTIPDKPAFKAGEVCELAQIQPYVLRSWESEFPELGLSKTPGGPRIYRRTDVERVLRIRDLVFTEGLTLSGVRRRFESEQPPPQDDLFTFVAEVQAAQAKAAQARAETESSRSAVGDLDGEPVARGVRTMDFAGDRVTTGAVAAGLNEDARSAIVQLRQEMRSLLDLLGDSGKPASTTPKRSRRA